MQAGASQRVSLETEKRHPFDFVLWKASKPNEPFGNRLGEMGDQVGILNVRQCQCVILATISIFMAVGVI